jgi:CRISPR system Cascade subunit CasC
MFIEIHMLQNFAPSNLNRDDTGNPKDTEFGGARRARISSQCIKRAIRSEPVFSEKTAVEIGVRTRWMNRMLADGLKTTGKDEAQIQTVANAMAVQYSKMDKGHTSVLIYLSKSEVQALIDQLILKWNEIISSLKDEKSPVIDAIAKELFKTLKGRTGAPDIALFGRMLAEKPELNIDAACQVAHAISTHRVSMDMDFYTAVDDLSQDDESGAGMMGVTAFNSACFYRYVRLDWEQLVKNLGGDKDLARKTVDGFLQATILAVPTGKQNSSAAQNPPDFLLGVVRKDGASWSLANAFEKPVKADWDGGYLTLSIAALDAYWGRLSKIYGSDAIHPVALALDENAPLKILKETLVENREAWIQQILAGLE